MDGANGFNSLMRNMVMWSCTVSSLVWCLLLFYQTMKNEPFILPPKLIPLYNKQLYRQFLFCFVAAYCSKKDPLTDLNTLSVSFFSGIFPSKQQLLFRSCCGQWDNKGVPEKASEESQCRWHQFLISVSHRLHTRKEQRFPFVLVLSSYNSLSLFLSHPLLLISPPWSSETSLMNIWS